MRQPLPRLRATFSLIFCLVLAGCASTTGPSNALGYYWQSLRGHMQIMHAAEPIDDWVARKDISPALRERLQLSLSVLASLLNTSDSTVRKWEQGDKRPSGPSLKLLHLLDRKGLEAVL